MRILAGLLLLAAAAGSPATPALSALDVDATQALLKDWKLDRAFGAQFREFGIDGEMLAAYAPGDLDAAAFPAAQKLHWKMLDLRLQTARRRHMAAAGDNEVAAEEEVVEAAFAASRGRARARAAPHRKLAAEDDGFAGVQIVSNKSKISFGEASDVELKRTGEGIMELVGQLHLREDAGDDDAVNVGAVLASLQLAALGFPPDDLCLPSCAEVQDRYPNAETGSYCIVVNGTATDLHCDMDTMGGGWTYVARGSDSSDGCEQDAYGSVSDDPSVNSRWSLGQDAINRMVQKYEYLEYLVTIGENNDDGYDPLNKYRAFRVSTALGVNLAEPMDATYNIQVWQGNHWVTAEFECNALDCGPCWEPGRQNFCCDDTFTDCELAALDREGQWSNSNTNQHLRCDVADDDQDALIMFVRGSNVRGQECYSSCYQAKQHRPDAPSGVYCIIIGGDEANRKDLYCDMETMGGGWTYVARGSNANDGCDTDPFGTVSADHFLNSRWSLGDWAINEIGYDQGTQWLEYYVTVGQNNDLLLSPHDYHRVMRVPLGDNFTLGSGMDVDYDVEVWSGSSWVAMSQGCDSSDCGPCWQPSYQNWCCQMDQSGLLLDCAQAGVNLEGQWSNGNTNQHLRCDTSDYDQDQLVLFVR